MIPQSFRLMGQEIAVSIIPESDWTDDDAVGMWLPQKCAILIRDGLEPQVTQLAFLHEAVHAMLERMGRDKLNRDEAFVDVFANLILQMWTSVERQD